MDIYLWMGTTIVALVKVKDTVLNLSTFGDAGDAVG